MVSAAAWTSSAAVERIFSKAGKLHDGAQATEDDALEAALFPSANTELS